MPKVPGWANISGRFSKYGFAHSLMADIAYDPLHFGVRFGSEI